VNVLAFLQASALAQLLRALPPPHRVTNVSDWLAVVALTRHRHYDAAVIDPTFGADQSVAPRIQAMTESAHTTPISAYVAVTAAAIKAAQSIGRLAPPDVSNVVVRGVDDAPEPFAATIHRVVAASAASAIVSSAGDPFGALPLPVARAVEAAFHRPERVRSVSALASEARTTRRSLDRWLARTGLAPARTLLACARANAAFHLLAAGHVRTSRAAAMVGYTSPRALARELHALTGHAPSAIPGRLTQAEFARAIGRQLRRSTPSEPTPIASD
jgi:AraC-like DNA-binding protein